MTYSVDFTPSARKDLLKLPPEIYLNVRDAITQLRKEPRPHGCLKMKGRIEWRIRVGRYRVRYKIDDTSTTVTILHVGHRRDAYRE